MKLIYSINLLNGKLDIQLPSRLSALDFKKIYSIEIGSSFWVAKIAEFLWREYVEMDAIGVQSYDFVNSRYIVSPDDIVVIFSHRGTKTFSLRALEVVKEQ